MSDEFEFENIPGVPGKLPEGERLLWQGSPVARSLAFKLYHIGWIMAYFAALVAWRIGMAAYEQTDFGEALASASWMVAIGAISLWVLALMARLTARNTIYSITTKRVIMRYGVALPLTINLPFTAIDAAELKDNGDGTGNIALTMTSGTRIAYLHLWPNARPWFLRQPQPLLRSLTDYRTASDILRREFVAANPELARQQMPAAKAVGASTARPSSEPYGAQPA